MRSTSTQSEAEHVSAIRSRIDDVLPKVVEGAHPASLVEPARYVLDGGGKRIRPTLLLLVATAYGRSVKSALPAALAVEVFHNFTLVHDDIMDASDERRGRPTVHVKWDVETAILVGDFLMGRSYELLGQVDDASVEALYEVYHPMVQQLCSGQALDAAFEGEEEVSVDAYLDMVDGKTAALLSAALELGAVVGSAPSGHRERLRAAGRLVGRAFQIQDDLLDVTAEGEEWGRAVGGDLVNGKKTYITLRALERAEGREFEWFARLARDGGLPSSDVGEARDRMARLGVFDDARDAVAQYTDGARRHLEVLPAGTSAEALHWLLHEMEARRH